MLRKYVSFLLVSLLVSCHSNEKPPVMPPMNVTDYVVQPQTIPATYTFLGFAQSSHPVEIRARVEGYLDKIAYQEGQLVKEGDLLFQLDPKQYEALVAQSKAEVAKQQSVLENAKLTVERLRPLYQQKAASKKDLDNAIATMLSAEASLQAAQAQLQTNTINLGYTTITTPITGYSDKSQYREGALITPGPNSLLTTVSVLDPIWVYFTVSDNTILQSRQQEANKTLTIPGNPKNNMTLSTENEWEIEAILSDGSAYPKKGKVDFSSPNYEQSTGTLLVRGVFSNPEGALRPGQFVRIKMYGAEYPNALLVPQRALFQTSSGMSVFLITDENKVVSQDVSTGDWYNDYQIITNGLKPGDRIVVDGINKIQSGMAVNVTGPWKDPNANGTQNANDGTQTATPTTSSNTGNATTPTNTSTATKVKTPTPKAIKKNNNTPIPYKNQHAPIEKDNLMMQQPSESTSTNQKNK